jgi:hypothetical protein
VRTGGDAMTTLPFLAGYVGQRISLDPLPSLTEAPTVESVMIDSALLGEFRAICARLRLSPDRVIASAVKRFVANPPTAALSENVRGMRRLSCSLPSHLVEALGARAREDKVTLGDALTALLNVALAPIGED